MKCTFSAPYDRWTPPDRATLKVRRIDVEAAPQTDDWVPVCKECAEILATYQIAAQALDDG